ncbi:elongation of fatty acids protein 3-like [Salvia hispanica]|uniref:elongation of fatty acids protein 3-like n=1 Tax=Salvia hispanica TaxID=49212 RepID=UPI002009BA1A|nr:elongation of fatty acids protein 3-like [Salvia hispanica]
MSTLYATAHYWLVEHPSISQYEWIPNQSPGSTPLFLFATVATYLSLTLLLSLRPLPSPPPFLRLITAFHSLLLCLLSLLMAVACTLSALHQSPTPTWPICFPANHTPPRGPTFFWAHVFYLSKIAELLDTLLILLSGARGRRRLTLLHVYHHAAVVAVCRAWVSERQSLFPVALVTNAAVHVLMYAYYLLCAIGIRPRWKRVVTDLQILQFVFSFAVSGWMLRIHFGGGPGCEGIRVWCVNAVFNASLLALFADFHVNNYAKRKRLAEDGDNKKIS